MTEGAEAVPHFRVTPADIDIISSGRVPAPKMREHDEALARGFRVSGLQHCELLRRKQQEARIVLGRDGRVAQLPGGADGEPDREVPSVTDLPAESW